MGKKKVRKHQKEPNESSHSSEDENNEATNSGKICPHISKSVSLNGVKKVLKRNGVKFGQCETCQSKTTQGSTSETDINGDIDVVWLCLQCGYQGCGRDSNGQHALHHFKTPRSDPHSIVTNTTTWEVWCYECDDEVNGESNKMLSECINFIKRQKNGKKSSDNSRQMTFKGDDPTLVNGVGHSKQENRDTSKKTSKRDSSVSSSSDIPSTDLVKVKGLRNLGNTCFFNAIMQNLTHCHWMSLLMDYYCSKDAKLNLPETEISSGPCGTSVQLDPLALTLGECGSLTKSLVDFFREMRSSPTTKNCVINPGNVFGEICKKAVQFRGQRQHDSHELLRHLIDGIRTEEIKRGKSAILKVFNLKEKTDPKTVPEDTKQNLRAYGRLTHNTIVDWLFGGQLISTVLCKECDELSQICEQFLDLSLPVAEEKPLRPGAHKRTSIEDSSIEASSLEKNETVSRHQEKKAKRKARKEAKKAKGNIKKSHSKELNSPTISSENGSEPDEKMQLEYDDSEHSDSADVEDNVESESLSVHGNGKQHDANSTNVAPEELCCQLNDVSLQDENSNSDETFEFEGDKENCSRQKFLTNTERTRLRKEWIMKSLSTLAPRYHPASHECSVLSCLNQFTAPELLTGNNKFGCQNCTRIRNEKLASKSDEAHKKINVVYSNASKQLLILCPPAVMTLHLKRFQQVGQTLRKVNRHVEFPLVLDLAPFCSSICVGLPTMSPNQSHVLYSLFGVVEHSGRLASGHYTAFVKSRNANPAPQKFLNCKPASGVDKLVDDLISQAQYNSHSNLQASGDESCSKNVEELIKSRSGKWYYISDSTVQEVPEATVLKSQAYILFYERIL